MERGSINRRFATNVKLPAGAGPEPGTTEHALFVLVILEVLALIALRRYFRTAHGG